MSWPHWYIIITIILETHKQHDSHFNYQLQFSLQQQAQSWSMRSLIALFFTLCLLIMPHATIAGGIVDEGEMGKLVVMKTSYGDIHLRIIGDLSDKRNTPIICEWFLFSWRCALLTLVNIIVYEQFHCLFALFYLHSFVCLIDCVLFFLKGLPGASPSLKGEAVILCLYSSYVIDVFETTFAICC